MQWVYLLAASAFEIGWIFSLKNLSISAIKKLSFSAITRHPMDSFLILSPLLGYISFGLLNIYFFSLAMKQLPASTAFAVWMSATLAGVKLIELFFLKEVSKPIDFFYLALIVIALIGLKKG